jgi:hypothetical protein
MILVRDVFRLQFGKAREALTAFKAVGQVAQELGYGRDSFRVMTDLVGPLLHIGAGNNVRRPCSL